MLKEKIISKGKKLAIFFGVSEYKSELLDSLPSCNNDVEVMELLITGMKNIDDYLIIKNEESKIAREELFSFVEKHKSDEVYEVTFYYSGHGYRDGDNYYFTLSDYEYNKRETTGITQDLLDGLIKSLNPDVYVKIVDSCFSGSKYIKSVKENGNYGEYINKAAKKVGLNNLYWFFSSQDDNVSFAGDSDGLSLFTEKIVDYLIDSPKAIRYVDFLTAITESFYNKNDSQKPTYIQQGSLTQKMGDITDELLSKAYVKLGIEPEILSNGPEEERSELEMKIIEIKNKSENVSFTRDELINKLGDLNKSIVSNIPEYIEDIFDVSYENKKSPYYVPNVKKIGEWLKDKPEIYADIHEVEEVYESSEYVRPKNKTIEKVISKKNPLDRILELQDFGNEWSNLRLLGQRDRVEREELVLETVKNKRKVISGFEYKNDDDNNILKLILSPKYPVLPKLVIYFIYLYNNGDFYIHYSVNELMRKDWDQFEDEVNDKWNVLVLKNFKKSTGESIAVDIIKRIKETLDNIILKSF